MIDSGIDASSIVMVTFTDAAALEMKERFVKNYEINGPLFCTIHSLCRRILAAYSNMSVRILSPEEQFSILYAAARKVKLPAGTALKDILSNISAFKNTLSEGDFKPTFVSKDEFKKIYPAY